jgi:beta-lactamase regulating signal transducer with metallopeptidase domain
MLNLLIYLLEVSVLTSIFYLFYRYLYFKLAYFELCRYYFLAFLVISFVLPLLPSILSENAVSMNLKALLNSGEMNGSHSINYINVEDSYLYGKESLFSYIPFVKIIFIVWVSGFVRYIFIISKNMFSVFRLIKKGEKTKDEEITIVRTDSKNSAFTFFRYIFINKAFLNLPENERAQILRHEKVHAKQLHSFDNVLFEFMRAVLWFNPVSKLISANIKIIHEFIVDNTLTENKNVPDYSRLILKMAVHNSHALTVSSFSSDEIKNRIKLISSPESQKRRKRRFNGSVPVLFITIFAAYLIISTVNIYAKENTQKDTVFDLPFKKGSYKIISPFFENKSLGEIYTGYERNIDENDQYTVSHRKVIYEVKSYTEVYAIGSGTVSHIKREDVFGLEELTVEIMMNSGYKITYKGLYKLTVKENDSVESGETIGLTGDLRLYPTVMVQLFENSKAVDPELYY